MGNCVFKGFGVMEVEEMVKVVTTNGAIMELFSPISVECITNEFPGHAIYRSPDFCSPPLLHNEDLRSGHIYYLLPLKTNKNTTSSSSSATASSAISSRTNSSSTLSSSSKLAPYRMSFDNQRLYKRSSDHAAEVFPRYNNGGVWKVKLVISPEELADILAQEARTEELIENVRTVAKCGNGFSSSVTSSDQWSTVSSSWKGSAEKIAAVDC